MKNVWILNHYATNMFAEEGGRHYWFAKFLNENKYTTTIFCASTIHNSLKNIDTKNQKMLIEKKNGIPFVFVNTPEYKNNGKDRIINMISFYKNVQIVAKQYAGLNQKPDIIIASSVHPLTLLAGWKLAKFYKVPFICEVRDLWPESIVAYGLIKKESIFAKMMYEGEKWLYKKADRIIMSWEGGEEYIIDKGWDKVINLDKITHISNGVSIDTFDAQSVNHVIQDPDLDNLDYKTVVYTGSIRKVNNIGLLLDAAKIVSLDNNDAAKSIKFIIYGEGDQLPYLKARCENESINNVVFKGKVDKKYIPSIVKKSYINILHNSSSSLNKYGQSQNKLYEYLAAGRPIIQTYDTNYNICKKYDCGIVISEQSPKEIANAIILACKNEEINQLRAKNARLAATHHDFEVLTNKLINVIEKG